MYHFFLSAFSSFFPAGEGPHGTTDLGRFLVHDDSGVVGEPAVIALAMEPRDDYISAVSQDDEHEKMAYMPEDLRYILLTSCL